MSGLYDDDDDRMLIELFYEIDENGNGEISYKELSEYLGKRGYKESDIDKWMKHFDENNDGKISLDEFLNKLKVSDSFYERPTHLEADIEVINASTTTFHKQYIITNVVRRALRKFQEDKKEAAKYIKNQLDSQMTKLWHCVMVKGQYWAFYSHEPEHSMVFKYKNIVFVVFRTPSL